MWSNDKEPSIFEKDLPRRSLEGMERQPLTDSQHEVNEQGLGSKRILFLLVRSTVGVGVLSLPTVAQNFGVLGFVVAIVSIGGLLQFTLNMLIEIADDLKFSGPK